MGGVLIDLDIKRSLSAFNAMLLPDEVKADTSLQRHSVSDIDLLGGGESPLISLYQKGDISTEDFISALLSACVHGTTRQQIVDAWNAMLIGLPAHRIEMIRSLKASGLNIYMLSNINELHVRWTLDCFAKAGLVIGEDVDRVFFSNEMHCSKPDPHCYQIVLEQTGIVPQETLYIDDLSQNIAVGRQLGFQCLQALGDEWLDKARMLCIH